MEKSKLCVFLLFSFLLLGCTTKEKTISQDIRTTTELLPDAPGYTVHSLEGETGQAFGEVTRAGVFGLTENILLSEAARDRMIAFTNCVSKSGALSVKGYSSNTYAADVGLIAIGEENSKKLLKCITFALTQPQSVADPNAYYGICGASYTVNTKNSKYHIAFIGVSSNVCEMMCSPKSNCVSSDVKSTWLVYPRDQN